MQNCGLGSSGSSLPCRHASWPIPHPRLQRHGERCRDCGVDQDAPLQGDIRRSCFLLAVVWAGEMGGAQLYQWKNEYYR
jgi:hypothetical protein